MLIVDIKQKVTYLPIIRADPNDYVKKYGSSLLNASEMPKDILNLKNPEGIVLAADVDYQNTRVELEGDIEALKLIDDLDGQGLGEYKDYVKPKREVGFISSPAAASSSTPTSNLTSISNLSNCLIANNNNNNNNMPNNLTYTTYANNNSNMKNFKYNDDTTQLQNQSNTLGLIMTPPSTISYNNSSNIIRTLDLTLKDGTIIDEKSLLTAVNEIFHERQKNGYLTSKETFNVLTKLDRSIGRQLGEAKVKNILSSHLEQNGLIDRNGFESLFQQVLLTNS